MERTQTNTCGFHPWFLYSENLRLREVQGTNHHFFYSPVRFYSVSPFGGFLKWWVSPTTMGFFLLKMIILGCEMGVPPFKERPISLSRGKKTSSSKNEKLESRFINGGARCDFLRDLLFQCVCWWRISEMKRNETHLKFACIKVHCTELSAKKKRSKHGFIKLNKSSFATQSLPPKLQKNQPWKTPTIFHEFFQGRCLLGR